MKLRYLIPLYLLLGTVTFCSRKATKDENKETEITEETMQVPEGISGKLELDTTSNRIYADIWLTVDNTDFRYASNFLDIKTASGYKGIAFQYFNTVNNAPDSGRGTVPMHVVFDFNNGDNWQVNDTIRVMSLNEEDKTVFEGLKPYFVERMGYFRNDPSTLPELITFNNVWNSKNPTNPVYVPDSLQVAAKNHKSDGNISIMTPRITKDGGILSLTLKK